MSVTHFAITTDGDGRVKASGELSFETAARALRCGLDLLRPDGAWVIDLSGVTSGDSAGIAVLVEWLAAVRAAGGNVRYEGVPTQMLAIARISDLDDLLLSR
jgi:phospholipid transport system transporter-binding protein